MVLLFARVMGEKYAGTPLAKYFTTSECSRIEARNIMIHGMGTFKLANLDPNWHA